MKKSIFFIVIVAICALDYSISSAQNYDELITRSFDYLDADSLPEAEEALREALRIEPGNPGNGMLLLNLGTIQRRQGKLKEAEESYTIGLAFLTTLRCSTAVHSSLLRWRNIPKPSTTTPK